MRCPSDHSSNDNSNNDHNNCSNHDNGHDHDQPQQPQSQQQFPTPTSTPPHPTTLSRVGITLWHFLEEDQGAGRCYRGTVKALRASNCIVEYDLAERFPEAHHGGSSWEGKRGCNGNSPVSSAKAGDRGSGGGGGGGRGDSAWNGTGRVGSGGSGEPGTWAGGFRASSCEEVEPFRVTLPRSQLSTLVLNGKSPAAAKLAAHGVVCEVRWFVLVGFSGGVGGDVGVGFCGGGVVVVCVCVCFLLLIVPDEWVKVRPKLTAQHLCPVSMVGFGGVFVVVVTVGAVLAVMAVGVAVMVVVVVVMMWMVVLVVML